MVVQGCSQLYATQLEAVGQAVGPVKRTCVYMSVVAHLHSNPPSPLLSVPHLGDSDDNNGDGDDERLHDVLHDILSVVLGPDHHHQRRERGHGKQHANVAGEATTQNRNNK